jgi:phytoene dehydrogenase-like protein
MSSAIVVGSGPNGLACAAHLAAAGVAVTVIEAQEEIGGGLRSGELTVPGVLHDLCSGFHPTSIGMPSLGGLGLDRHGLEWLWPEVELAHPLDRGGGAAMRRSLAATAAELGPDRRAWERLFGPPSRGFAALAEDIMRPVLHLPRHPLRLARFGLPSLLPATALARGFEGEEAKALFGGVAAHSFAPLTRPLTAAVGMALLSAGHSGGWPVARGGSGAIAAALAAAIRERGGTIETGRTVRSLAELPAADAVVLDLAPAAVERLPARVARAYRRYRRGPGAFKLDLAVRGGVPWEFEPARRAGTVHVGGSLAEIAAAERDVNRGRMPERPFVLVGQQYLADPGRSAGDLHPLWAYAHVPAGYDGDAGEAIVAQIERFAPGLRERIVASTARPPARLEAENANYVGGDIATGANTPWQTLIRPRLALDPYATGVPGLYICSAATPPGAGAHGMCGYNAARRVLAQLGAA